MLVFIPPHLLAVLIGSCGVSSPFSAQHSKYIFSTIWHKASFSLNVKIPKRLFLTVLYRVEAPQSEDEKVIKASGRGAVRNESLVQQILENPHMVMGPLGGGSELVCLLVQVVCLLIPITCICRGLFQSNGRLDSSSRFIKSINPVLPIQQAGI